MTRKNIALGTAQILCAKIFTSDDSEIFRAARGTVVNPAGHHSLPCAGFAGEHNWHFALREFTNRRFESSHGRTPGLYKIANVVNYSLGFRVVVDLPLHC